MKSMTTGMIRVTNVNSLTLLVPGGSGVLGRTLLPLALSAGYRVLAPSRKDLDLFSPTAVASLVERADAVIHLATRIPPISEMDRSDAWRENDRLRSEASRILVDAALHAAVAIYIQPTVAFAWVPTSTGDAEFAKVPPILRSALDAEDQAMRFACAGRQGIALRLGILDGPNTSHVVPDPRLGATLDSRDAGRALLAALRIPSGIYCVCRDGEPVSNRCFSEVSGWRPER